MLFCTSAYTYLAQSIAKELAIDIETVERKHFPDTESYHRIVKSPYNKDIILIGGTPTDADVLELYDLACTLVSLGARSLILIIPYFGYSTMERAVRYGEAVKAKTRARLLSSMPRAAMGNTALLLDLHSEGIPFYFNEPVHALHLYAKPVILDAIREIGGKEYVLGSTDAGRAKWVESLSNELQVPSAFVFKKRLNDDKVALTGINADVGGKKVVIYDDMIRSGSSLLNAANAYLENGATEIYAVCSHVILPNNALHIIQSSGKIKQIIGTDSHPRSQEVQSNFLQIRTISTVFTNFLKNEYYL